MSRRERTLHQSWPVGTPEAQHALSPRSDLVEDEIAASDGSSTTFVQREGPFTSYQRTVSSSAETVNESIRYRISIPWFGWLFALPVRNTLRRRPHDNAMPWWSPPDRLSQRNVATLGLLAAASMAAAFANTLFTQTASFAADGFGIDERAQGVGGVIVRLGVVIAIPFALIADHRGRRLMIVVTAWVAPIWCALGAIAPNFWVLVGTQTIGRPVGLALALLIGVVAAEEYPEQVLVRDTRIDDDGVMHESQDVLSGQTSADGPVVLSWSDAHSAQTSDTYNVVIHEFVHKLDLRDGIADGCPPLPRGQRNDWLTALHQAWQQFAELCDKAADSVPTSVDGDSQAADVYYAHLPLDPYAATDPAEFFAVLGEVFFTDPARLTPLFAPMQQHLQRFFSG